MSTFWKHYGACLQPYCWDIYLGLIVIIPFHDCGVLPNWPGSMILMVVVATESVDDMPFKQFTTVPFRLLLTRLTVTLDTSGELFWPESLKKMIIEELIINGGGTPLVPADETGTVVWVIFSGKTVNSHLWTVPDEVHVSSSWSPTRQTGATDEGESSTNPEMVAY